MYRYLLFTYYNHYPDGGMEDCIFKSSIIDEVKVFIEDNRVHIAEDNLYIYDIQKDEIIYL